MSSLRFSSSLSPSLFLCLIFCSLSLISTSLYLSLIFPLIIIILIPPLPLSPPPPFPREAQHKNLHQHIVYTSVLHPPGPSMFLLVSDGDSIIAGHRLLHPGLALLCPTPGNPPPVFMCGTGVGRGRAGRGGAGLVYTILAVLSWPPPAPADGLMNLHS